MIVYTQTAGHKPERDEPTRFCTWECWAKTTMRPPADRTDVAR